MPVQHLYLDSFPEQHKVEEADVVTLYHEERFDELDKVVVCKDESGKVTAYFGDSAWYCFAFSRDKREYNNTLNFNQFNNNKDLQRELKLFTYGWLFNKGLKQRKALKFSSTLSRLKYTYMPYRHLVEQGFDSIRALSKSSNWTNFEGDLVEKQYSQSSIRSCVVSINAIIRDSAWHKVKHEFLGPLKPDVVARRLIQLEAQQTLTIPERLCDAIYGKAIELIEEAHPNRKLIAQVESELQENYREGDRRLNEKVASGESFPFMLANGEIDKNIRAAYIRDNKPRTPSDIISPLAQKLPNIPLANSAEFKRYREQLINASYIVCGGFSGMRDSELDKLTPNSYYKDTFEGREYHMLQSHTFKLGEKRETWVTASSSKIAIELMTTLTERWRQEVTYPDKKYTNTLWVNQSVRSTPPTLISSWNARLQKFCKQFNFIVTEEDHQECLDSNPRSHGRVKKYVLVGKPWHMATHQFRRSLAFYCIKNRFGTTVALKQQFKHLYIAMTEWYTNGGKLASYRSLVVDEKIQSMLEDINAETTANKIFKQWHSSEKLSGSHGKVIMQMRGDVPTIYSSWDVIYKAVKDGKLTLHGTTHSYCKNGYNCDMDGVVMPQFCVDCGSGSSIIDGEQARWWQKKHNSLVAYMESDEDISVSERSHYITQVRAAEIVMADFELPFTPFEPDLKVANS